MPVLRLLPIVAVSALLAAPAAAFAQESVNPPEMNSPDMNAADMGAPSATNPSVTAPASATTSDPSAPLGSPANPIPESSPTPANLAYTLTPNDPHVVTNGPVPDTPANRRLYGEPMSATGRATTPSGD